MARRPPMVLSMTITLRQGQRGRGAALLAKCVSRHLSPGQPAAGLYRPGLTLSFIADRMAGGSDDSAWAPIAHLHSIALHLAVVLLLFFLLRPLFGVAAALGASAWFAVHAVLVEPVAWISARSDLPGWFLVSGGRTCFAQQGLRLTRAALLASYSWPPCCARNPRWRSPGLACAAGRRRAANQERLHSHSIRSRRRWRCVGQRLVRVFISGAVSPTLSAFAGAVEHTFWCFADGLPALLPTGHLAGGLTVHGRHCQWPLTAVRADGLAARGGPRRWRRLRAAEAHPAGLAGLVFDRAVALQQPHYPHWHRHGGALPLSAHAGAALALAAGGRQLLNIRPHASPAASHWPPPVRR